MIKDLRSVDNADNPTNYSAPNPNLTGKSSAQFLLQNYQAFAGQTKIDDLWPGDKYKV